MADAKRRSARQRAERKRSLYFEPDSDDFEEAQSDGETDFQQSPAPAPSPAPGPSQTSRAAKKRKVESRRKPQTRARESRSKRSSRQPGAKPKRRGLNWVPSSSSTAKPQDPASKGFTGPSDGKIPDWRALPAEILRQIFVFASQPIVEQTTIAQANVKWLMRTAHTCRAFAVPALEAFYESPALHDSLHPHSLLQLMTRGQDELYIHYKYRVKSLNIDIRRLTYVAHNKRPFQVGQLLEQLPRLRNLDIVHPVDAPPYRPLYRCQPWHYPANLSQHLESADIRLKGFRWTRDMIPADFSEDVASMYSWMTAAHTSKPFEYLERLVVCGYDFKNSAFELLEGMPSRPHGLASAISTLPHLRDLTFISCEVVMEDFLEHIPKNLERLELSNCLEITSEMLSSYLKSGGAHLRELVLNHNAALNLAFLQRLQAHCPRLEVLKMNLTYYSERFNSNDAVALYDQLLTEDQIPTWPSALRHVELLHLQNWEGAAAQNLFRSLVESAEGLPNLRCLVVQAHISKMEWRNRAMFRDQWIERLRRVYLQKSASTNPHLGSLKQFRLWKESQKARLNSAPVTYVNDSDDDLPLRRKLSHVRVTPGKVTAEVEIHSVAESSTKNSARLRARRSVRVAESQSATAAEESSSESEDGSDDGWRRDPEAFIQGLCNVVDIRIDNQRPRENQFTGADFLDSEPSGDEDWREDADASDAEQYAW